MPDLELPEVKTIGPDDLLYVPFLEDSVKKLIDMVNENIRNGGGLIGKLEAEGLGYDAINQHEGLNSLKMEKDQIEKRLSQFRYALLKTIDIRSIYQPEFPPHCAQVFFKGDDEFLYETELDFPKNRRTRSCPTAEWTEAELKGPQGKGRAGEIYEGHSVYFVTSPSTMILAGAVIAYAADKLQVEFNENHPDITAKREAEQEKCPMKGLLGAIAIAILSRGSCSSTSTEKGSTDDQKPEKSERIDLGKIIPPPYLGAN